MSEFKIGDVVRLKSGGPAMTVGGLVDGLVRCIWFTDLRHVDQCSFDYEMLNLVKD